MDLILYTLCFILLALLVIFIIDDMIRPPDFPPGPAWLPVLGCYHKFQSIKSRLGYNHLVWSELARQYGPLVGLKLGRDRIVIVSGFDAVQHVLTTHDFDGRPDGFYFRMRTFNERLGIAFADGELWQQQRQFTVRHLRQLGLSKDGMERLILDECRALSDMLSTECTSTEGTEMVLSSLCSVSVFNSLWTVVAGQRFELDDERLQVLFTANNDFFKNVDVSGGILNRMPFLRYIAPEMTGYNALQSAVDTVHSYLQEAVAEHRMNHDREDTRDLIDVYLKEIELQKDNTKSTFSERQLLSVCVDLFQAGSETTSNTLAFCLLYLLHHPDVQRRVQKDIDRVITTARLPSLADRAQLPYLDAVIMEVWRLVSVGPMTIPHRPIKNCELMGYQVPKDTMLLVSLWSVHMDSSHWKDPTQFKPERFLDASGENLIQDDWLIPFGLGRRRCLGEALGKNTTFLILATLLQNFTFDLVPEQDPPSLEPLDGMTLSPRPFTGIVTPR